MGFLFKNSPAIYIINKPKPLIHPPCILHQNNIIIGKNIKFKVLPCRTLSNKYKNNAKNKQVNNKHLTTEPKLLFYIKNWTDEKK